MKPKLLSNQTTAFVLIGRVFAVAFAWCALHLSAEAVRISWNEELMLLSEPHPTAIQMILDADTFLQARWILATGVAVIALWFDQELLQRLAFQQKMKATKIWTYSVFGLVLLFAGMCVGSFRFWLWSLNRCVCCSD